MDFRVCLCTNCKKAVMIDKENFYRCCKNPTIKYKNKTVKVNNNYAIIEKAYVDEFYLLLDNKKIMYVKYNKKQKEYEVVEYDSKYISVFNYYIFYERETFYSLKAFLISFFKLKKEPLQKDELFLKVI